MEAISDLILNNWRIILAGLALVGIAALIYQKWERIRLWLKSVRYRLPLVGRIRSLAKNGLTLDRHGWFKAERELCSDFYREYRQLPGDPEMYSKSRSYLKKVQELGRNELRWWGWVLLFAIIAAEALGFAFILAGYTVPGLSLAIETNVAFLFAVVIASLLMVSTHMAGRELHKRRLINMARTWWSHDKRGEEDKPFGAPDTNVDLENDHKDDHRPQYQQIINRVDHDGLARPVKPLLTILAAFFIAVVFAGSTYVRVQVWQQEQAEETKDAVDEQQQAGGAGGASDDPSAVFDSGGDQPAMPDDVQKEAQGTLDSVVDKIQAAEDRAAYATYIMLGVIFVVLQIISIVVGYRTGFVGKESKKAREIVGNFSSRREYEDHLRRQRERVMALGQHMLDRLQRRLLKDARHSGVSQDVLTRLEDADNRTFRDYVRQADRAEQAEEAEAPEESGGTEAPASESLEEMRRRAREQARREAEAQQGPAQAANDQPDYEDLLAEERRKFGVNGGGR